MSSILCRASLQHFHTLRWFSTAHDIDILASVVGLIGKYTRSEEIA